MESPHGAPWAYHPAMWVPGVGGWGTGWTFGFWDWDLAPCRIDSFTWRRAIIATWHPDGTLWVL